MKQFIEENGGECFAVAADVRDYAAVENAIAKTVEHYGKIDIVVNGAAGNFLCAADQLSAERLWHGRRYRYKGNVQRLPRRV